MPQRNAGAIRHPTAPRSVANVLEELDKELRTGAGRDLIPIPTGFSPLDSVLAGGVRAGELTLVGGQPGVGKTIVTLQWARNMALQGNTAVYACYEHDEIALLGRLLALELGSLPHGDDDSEMEKLRLGLQEVASGSGRGLREVLDSEGLIQRAYEHIESYAHDLLLVKASSARTGLEELEKLIDDHRPAEGRLVLFVDYLQKVSVRPEPPDESEKVTKIAEALKDMALRKEVPIVCVVAGDQEGLRAKRLRLHHLRGSSALAYEPDVVLLLNDKFNCVSKVHLAYDATRAATYRDFTVFTIEKNRGGPNLVDLEFRKDFVYYRYDPLGGIVEERLIDERIYEE